MIDMEMRTEHVINFVVTDAESEQLIPPALLAGEIEGWRMPFVFPSTGIHQNGVARRPNDESLIRDEHHP